MQGVTFNLNQLKKVEFPQPFYKFSPLEAITFLYQS